MDDANYDDIAALVRHKTKAQAVLLMVIDGKRGSGMAATVRGNHSLSEADKENLMLELFQKRGASAMQKDLGVAPRAVAPAQGEIKSAPKLELHRHATDSEDQVLLRQVIGDEVEAVLKKYDVGGALMLVSRDSASWRSVFPSWCGLQPDPVTVLRLRMSSKTPEAQRDADCTMHFIATLREMCSDYANFYGRLWRQAVDALKVQGGTVEHRPLAKADAVGGRPDPMGGGVE